MSKLTDNLKAFVLNMLTSEDARQSTLVMPSTSRLDYGKAVGSGLQSSVVMAAVQWIQTNFQEAMLEVCLDGEDIDDHPMTLLVNKPNPFYRGDALWNGTILSFLFDGNGYWLKKRKKVGDIPWFMNVAGKLEQLWYVPHWLIEPAWPSDRDDVFISHYVYSVGGQQYQVSPENVVHFRNGIDPRNTRKGISRIEPVLREIFIDDESANWVASLLLNRGIPGVVISPESGQPAMEKNAREALAEAFIEKTTGAKRGKPLVTNGAIKVSTFGFNPQEMDFGDIRNTPEERVCAMIGIPAAIIGFGTGVQQTKVGATMSELRRLAWEGGLIPMQNTMAMDLQQSLLPEFGDVGKKTVEFDQENVAALQDNLDTKTTRVNAAVQGGWLRVDQAQRELGYEVDPTQNLYLRGMNLIEVPATDEIDPTNTSKSKIKTLTEQRIAASSRSEQSSEQQRRLMSALIREGKRFEADFEKQLMKFFDEMGRDLEAAALTILQPKAAIDDMNAASIIDLVDMERLKKLLKNMLGAYYLDVASSTYKTVNTVMGLATDFSDHRAAEITGLGGRRLGLIDLEKSTKDRLFKVLKEQREAGNGPVKIAREIRDIVPAGRWSSPTVRSRVIARTETLHAQRVSTLDSYRDSKVVDDVMVFDNRTGFDDPECTALDGAVVSIDEGYQLMNEEHPNGTRAFAPVIR